MTGSGNDIAERMMKIRGIHEDAQQYAASELNDEVLFAYLETTDAQFRSIAYEGSSMARGLLDIAEGDSLDRWLIYLDRTKAHAVQVHIGLGWALAQRQVPIFPRIQNLSPIIQARVLDGVGYYEGMFRNRTTIRDKVIPEDIKGDDLRAYDQGVGRCLWYMAKGNLVQLQKLVDGFIDERKPDLWRGIGIASSYVGGGDESTFKEMFDLAVSYQVQLASGAVFLTHSRAKAGTLNAETEFFCRLWCGLSAPEVISLIESAEPNPAESHDSYVRWVKGIEQSLIKQHPA
jgi:hypothetical protein